MNFLNVNLIGEEGDIPCTPTRENTIIKTKYGRFKTVEDATFQDWTMAIVFPDKEKALYFKDNFKEGMMYYMEGMLPDDYVFHVIHFEYPRRDTLYADQLYMRKTMLYY